MAAPRAIVLGAGIAGLAAAIALRKAGYGVIVVEQAPELRPMGAALSLWGNAMAALDWLGASVAVAAQAAPIRHLSACDQHGRAILHIEIARAYAADQPVPYLPTRTLLQTGLLDAASEVDLRLGTVVDGVEQSDASAAVRYADGSRDTADLVIAADGIGSETATEIIGTAPVHAGYGGVLALSDPAPGTCAPGETCEYWGRGERFGLFDLGHGHTYWFFMRNESSPAESRALAMADIERRLPDWPGRLGNAVRATSAALIPFSIHAKPPPTRLGRGRVVCVGDAAHAMEPNLGQGGCQSLEDAVALGIAAQCRAPEAVLPLFERLRLKRIRQFVVLSRSAGLVAQSKNHVLARAGRSVARAIPGRLNDWRVSSLHRLPDYAAMAQVR